MNPIGSSLTRWGSCSLIMDRLENNEEKEGFGDTKNESVLYISTIKGQIDT